MRTDIGWLYLLAGAGAVGAAVVYRNQTAGLGQLPAGTLPDLRSGVGPFHHVTLFGDELAISLAPPLARLLATKGISLDDRRTRPEWSTNDALILPPSSSLLVLALGSGRGLPGPHKGTDTWRWATNMASRQRPLVVLLHPRSPLAKEIRDAGQARRAPNGAPLFVFPLRDLPLGPTGSTPSMATAAAWAADLVHATTG